MAVLIPRRVEALTSIQGVALVVLSICAAVAALRLGQSFLAPVCLAVFIALTLAPIVRVLAKVLPRSLASAAVVIVLAGATSMLAYSLTDEASAVVRELPNITRQVRQAAQTAASQSGPFAQFQRAMTELQRLSAAATPVGQPTVAVTAPPLDITRGVLTGTWDLLGLAGQTLLLLFLVFFLLASGDLLKVKFVRISGDRLSRRKVTVQVIDQIGVQIGHFMLYVALSGIIVGVATWLAFAAMGMPYAG